VIPISKLNLSSVVRHSSNRVQLRDWKKSRNQTKQDLFYRQKKTRFKARRDREKRLQSSCKPQESRKWTRTRIERARSRPSADGWRHISSSPWQIWNKNYKF